MDFGLTEEQHQLAAAERGWLTKNDPIARVRATLDAAPVTIDSAAVAHAAESGLLALLTLEMGGTHVDLAVVAEEHGYAISSLPVADLTITAWLLNHVDSPAEDGKLTGLAVGPAAALDGDGLRLNGVPRPVPMAADMDSIAVAGQVGGDEYLVVLDDPTPSGMSTLDLSRSWARLDLDATIADWTRLPTGTLALLRDALAVRRAGRGGPAARHDGFLRRAARAIRRADRLVPGRQASLRRHGRRGGGRPSHVVGRGARTGHRVGSCPVPSRVRGGGVHEIGGRQGCRHGAAGARRHRVHLGTRSASVPAPDQGRRSLQRERRRTPRGTAQRVTFSAGPAAVPSPARRSGC